MQSGGQYDVFFSLSALAIKEKGDGDVAIRKMQVNTLSIFGFWILLKCFHKVNPLIVDRFACDLKFKSIDPVKLFWLQKSQFISAKTNQR